MSEHHPDQPDASPPSSPTDSPPTGSEDDHDLFLPGDDFHAWQKPVRIKWDDDEPDPEATTYTAATPGPQPVPSWVITEDAARQHELGLLKTGKEADVNGLPRSSPCCRCCGAPMSPCPTPYNCLAKS
ncbi:MAG: hypothetical protein ACR2H3_07985 [Acidimicrobiales bacterium]